MSSLNLNQLPWSLVLFRLAAGPVVVALAIAERRSFCAILLALGVLSDIFDGIIARRLNVATAKLRVWDSRADVIFWVCVLGAVILARPSLFDLLWLPALVIVAMEVGNHLVSFAKFRREASPHHYLSKLFGLALWCLCSLAFLHGENLDVMRSAIWTVLAIGVLSQLEAFAITMMLSTWRCDVPSVLTLRP